ncbi:MAG: hydrolase [Alcanivoracaceae bacterium]|nr:hydrolase [Alcanivoracaceae bacterium]
MTFKPARFLANPHVQTLWPTLRRKLPAVARREEKMPLPDGDHLWLHWGASLPDNGRIVVLLHGITGCSDSPYARGLQHELDKIGIASVVANARGNGGRLNDRPECSYAGETNDVHAVMEYLQEQHQARELIVIGYSLGGSRLLNYLVEERASPLIVAAATVCVPLDLGICARRLDQGFSRIYRKHLLGQLCEDFDARRAHLREHFPAHARRFDDIGPLDGISNFVEYDNRVIAPLYGFRDANDYYRQCSALPKLGRIKVPTLMIQAADDPFMTPAVLPAKDRISANITLEVTPNGGHVGFVAGTFRKPIYWLEPRLVEWISRYFNREEIVMKDFIAAAQALHE